MIHLTPAFDEKNVLLLFIYFSVYKNYEEKSYYLDYFDIHI